MPTVTGGYLLHAQPLIRGADCHTAALQRPVSQLDLDAINAVQATPWRINNWLLDVMLEAWAQGLLVAGVANTQRQVVPDRLADDVWAGMAREDRSAHLNARSVIHSENASADGRLRALLDNLQVAQDLRDVPAIYYPHSRCFRGRIHPIPAAGPQPQGNDQAKALLMFANGLPLGPDGELWLCVRAANCAGMDKLPIAGRVQWAFDNMQNICASAESPLTHLWWATADEPWQLLATCYELSQAWEGGCPSDFVSHLPIPMDGTCNGLQHLSAMALDPVGAVATNLSDTGIRQDIYADVAARVRDLVDADVVAGVAAALPWVGNVTRKTVKRAVMTTPYGVTARGIRDQLLGDAMVTADAEVPRGAQADYLTEKLTTALTTTAGAARGIMAWLQTTADRLARAEQPFEWTTPTGSRVRQAYPTMIQKRIQTLIGTLVVQENSPEAGLNRRKQALGAAPNFIHSFDAAHLSMTVLDAHDRGVRSFSMIHDSYGTHAANTTEMGVALRAQFVRIYREDWLADTHRELVTQFPNLDLPPPPARGSFDIEQVLSAPFFFS